MQNTRTKNSSGRGNSGQRALCLPLPDPDSPLVIYDGVMPGARPGANQSER